MILEALHCICDKSDRASESSPSRTRGIALRRSHRQLGRTLRLLFAHNPKIKQSATTPSVQYSKKAYPASEAVQMKCATKRADKLASQRLPALLAHLELP